MNVEHKLVYLIKCKKKKVLAHKELGFISLQTNEFL